MAGDDKQKVRWRDLHWSLKIPISGGWLLAVTYTLFVLGNILIVLFGTFWGVE